MKHLFSKLPIQLLVAVSLATITLPVLKAEHCPGNVASVTPRFVQRALIVIPVRINQAGPFDFMVDTGSQVTVIDPSLASELDLKHQGTVGLVSVANYAQASVAEVDTLEAGTKVVRSQLSSSKTLGRFRRPIAGFGASSARIFSRISTCSSTTATSCSASTRRRRWARISAASACPAGCPVAFRERDCRSWNDW